MDHVAAHENGNVQAALFDGGALHGVDFGRVDAVEDRADLAFGGRLAEVGAARYLVHLADLFAQGHLREQLVDAAVGLALGRAAHGREGYERYFTQVFH